MNTQIKSKQRVEDHGEVFTAEREVNAVLDLVNTESERVDSRFLEPACGDGNFLSEILRRKLDVAKRLSVPPRKRKIQPAEFEKQSVIAVTSIYGIDLLIDNVISCRKRLFQIWYKAYSDICANSTDPNCIDAIKFILSRNVICGNALSMKQVDENCNDLEEPIIFSEWSFVTGSIMQRRDFRFDKLLAGEYEPKFGDTQSIQSNADGQLELFGGFDGSTDDHADEGELLKEYIADYRRIQNDGK